jgi:hypothetical protein
MITKFKDFIKESYDLDLLAEIEQRFIIFDDMDIDYTIEEYISVTNNFNTYNIGYKIITNEINYDDISSVIRYFEKFYNVYTKFGFIIIIEEKVLTKEDILNMFLTTEQVKKAEEFSQDIFNRMIKKRNVWYVDDNEVFIEDDANINFTNMWWDFFESILNIQKYNVIQAITKALLEERNKKNYRPLWISFDIDEFIKESYDIDLLAEIEQRFVILDDIDINYTIEEYISTTNNFNTYNVGYKIRTNDEMEHDKITSAISYFEKYYTVRQKNFAFIIITEERILTKDEVLNMLLSTEQIKQVEEFSQDIFNRMIKKDNVWYLNNQWIFELDEKDQIMWCYYFNWWTFFVEEIGLDYKQIQVITKCLLEDHLKYNVFSIDWDTV